MEEGAEGVRKTCREDSTTTAGPADGRRGHEPQNMVLPEAGQGQDTDRSWGPPGEAQPCRPLAVGPARPMSDL